VPIPGDGRRAIQMDLSKKIKRNEINKKINVTQSTLTYIVLCVTFNLEEVQILKDEKVSSDLIRGHIDTIILRVLTEKDNYGYEIIKSIAAYSKEQYELKEPTLYTSLKRLETSGSIQSYWGDESHGGRRKYYKITNSGVVTYLQSVAEWKRAKKIIDLLVEGECK